MEGLWEHLSSLESLSRCTREESVSLVLDEAQGPGQCVLGIWQCLDPFLYEPLARDPQDLGVFWNQIRLVPAVSEADVH